LEEGFKTPSGRRGLFKAKAVNEEQEVVLVAAVEAQPQEQRMMRCAYSIFILPL
jgi:hypothetical protein